MHYHAIRKSNRSRERSSGQNQKEVHQHGPDDSTDCLILPRFSKLQVIDDLSSSSDSSRTQSDQERREYGHSFPSSHLSIHIPLPTSLPKTHTTHAHHRALANRISLSKLLHNSTYDLSKYTPTFIHDVLQLPGSLAALLSKGSSEDILRRITPALLPGYHAHIDAETLQPRLVRSDYSGAFVQGMLLFGQGKASRDAVHAHYRVGTKRRKVGVECDLWVEKSATEREVAGCARRLRRRTVQAHVWISSGEVEGCEGGECRDWSIEEYLAGGLGETLPMRVEIDGKGDEDEDGRLGEDDGGVSLDGEAKRNVKGGGVDDHSLERVTWLE